MRPRARPNLVVISHSRSVVQRLRGVQSSGTFTRTGFATPAFSAFATASSNVSPTATMWLSSSESATQRSSGAFSKASARACGSTKGYLYSLPLNQDNTKRCCCHCRVARAGHRCGVPIQVPITAEMYRQTDGLNSTKGTSAVWRFPETSSEASHQTSREVSCAPRRAQRIACRRRGARIQRARQGGLPQ